MTTPTPTAPGALNWALLNLLGVVWGTSFFSIGISLETLEPATLAALRVTIAAVVLTAALPLFKTTLSSVAESKALSYGALAGVIGFSLPFMLLAWGQQYVPSAVAGVAMGSVPLLLVPLVFFFSPDEGIGPRRIIGVVLGFLGLLLIVGPGVFDGDAGTFWALGATACVFAAFSYAVASVITRRSPAVHPLAFSAVELIAASVVLVPIALVVDGLPQDVSARSLIAVVWLGVFPTALAATLRVRIIKTAGSLFMSIAAFLVPLWSVIFGIALMGEELPAQLFAALALILAGIGVAQSRQLAAFFRRR